MPCQVRVVPVQRLRAPSARRSRAAPGWSRPMRAASSRKTSVLGLHSPSGRDGGLAEAQVEVAVGLVDVVVLEGGGRGQHDVGEVDGVGREQVVHDREQVLAREARAHASPARAPPPPGWSCRRRAPSPAGPGASSCRMRPSWLMLSVRVPGGDEVGPLQGRVVDRERARGGEQHAAARRGARRPTSAGRQAIVRTAMPAARVAVEPVVDADGRGLAWSRTRARSASISAARRGR